MGLSDYESAAWQALTGVVAAAIREVMMHDPLKPQTPWKIGASLVTGGMLAGNSATAMTTYWGLDLGFANAMAFFIGLIGIGLVMKVLNGEIKIPLPSFLKGGE